MSEVTSDKTANWASKGTAAVVPESCHFREWAQQPTRQTLLHSHSLASSPASTGKAGKAKYLPSQLPLQLAVWPQGAILANEM